MSAGRSAAACSQSVTLRSEVEASSSRELSKNRRKISQKNRRAKVSHSTISRCHPLYPLMRSVLPLAVGFLCFSVITGEAVETYKIDPVHSSAGFKIKHLFAKLPGRFTEMSGTITGDVANPEEAKVNVQINTASIVTSDAKRDEHLRSGEFFNAEEFPHITFTSKKVNRTGEDTAFVVGDLTMRGVTKESILQVKFLGRGKDAQGAMRTGWEAKTALKRSDYGLTWSKAVEGTQVVGDDVEIELNIEAVEEVAPPAIETTQLDPNMKAPVGAVPAGPGATDAPAAVATTDPLGALPPGGSPSTEKVPAVPGAPAVEAATPPVTPSAPSLPGLPLSPKTDAQSGNLPGAIPGEGSLPTLPNPAAPAAPGSPVPPPAPPGEPQSQPPAKPNDAAGAPEVKPVNPAVRGESEA